MAVNRELDAFAPTGGFPQFVPDANRATVTTHKEQIASKAPAPAGADILPVRPGQMKEGLSPGQVGQRPFAMDCWTMIALNDMKQCEAARPEPAYSSLNVCTPSRN